MINLGQLIEGSERISRDAVHVAVIPAIADDPLKPGQPVGMSGGYASAHDYHVGIVDPFLTKDVATGERFWVFMFPGTVKDLRHLWSHPDIDDDAEQETEYEYDDGCRGC